MTTTIRGVTSEVRLDVRDGLPRACAANLHNVFTLPKSDLGPFISTLSPSTMAALDRALVFALGVGEQSEA